MKEKRAYTFFKNNNALLGIAAIIAIVFIVWIAVNNNAETNNSNTSTNALSDNSGKASAVIVENIQDTALCRLIVGQSEVYDNTNLVTGLQKDSSTYYSGHNILVTNINSDGCQINIDGNTDYIAVGQIQKIGSLYVTVKSISG